MNLLGDHRRDIEAAQRRARRAHAWLTSTHPDADQAIIADLLRTAPDAVRAACERLSSQHGRTQQ